MDTIFGRRGKGDQKIHAEQQYELPSKVYTYEAVCVRIEQGLAQ